ncbi:hypothetical protein [Leptospira alstonii]|uniref:Uncharacterized protein n=2 Tax=Leptospira alstonii TaxID=28452 RepID=M6CQ52_9LEPT|nr:hypothetical protein [Leptospira alstonii]EMJ94072.1 hypothetical protein LEP1GSC194_2227 [Leptospira alstonii serovar Sichuan str. 79601]EQA80412.1 hypothetical protein LEP1GSC193_0021 [Leptospira alstonii serovar Pingchang str. 80-412]
MATEEQNLNKCIQNNVEDKSLKQARNDLIFKLVQSLGFDVRLNRHETVATDDDSGPNTRVAIIAPDLTYKSISPKHKWQLRRSIIKHFDSLLIDPDYRLNNNSILKNRIGNIALFQHPNSHVICIDVDMHNSNWAKGSRRALYMIIECLYNLTGVYPLYSEYSMLDRGFHVFYYINKSFHVESFGRLVKEFLQKNHSFISGIDIRDCLSKCVRLPLGADYVGNNVELAKESRDIDEVYCWVKEKLDSKDCIVNFEEVVQDLRIGSPELLPLEFRPLENGAHIWERIGVTGTKIPIGYDDIKITAGNRVAGEKLLWKLAFRCVGNSETYDTFKRIVFACNVDSKDLTELSGASIQKQDKILKSIYEYAIKKYKEFGTSYRDSLGFFSNLELLTELDEFNIEEAVGRNRNKNIKKQNLNIMTQEFVGKHNYECKNPRTISAKANLKRETKERLKHGVQFPLNYVDKAKEFHSLKGASNTLRSVIYNELDLFSKCGDYFKNENGSSCKQFKLNYVNEYNSGNKYMDPTISITHEVELGAPLM